LKFLNLGIVAHVDAGKTSLTERLLHNAGVIDELGRVDAGTTQTDTLALERARGITIKSAVVAFAIDDVAVNLIDTPGHPDFIAEVERVLRVLDGAVLVVSAVEGVQAQTRVLMRTLQRLEIPTLIFINKTDRRGANPARVAREVASALRIAAAPAGSTELAELLADHSDAFLAAYLNGGARVGEELTTQTRRALVHPVYSGSAITGAGVDELTRGIRDLLPAAAGDGPAAGTVFKVERGAAYVRMHAGTLHVRERFGEHKITAIDVFEPGGVVARDVLHAGQIGKVSGLRVRIGGTLGAGATDDGRLFAPPTLETVVEAEDRVALHRALTELAEQDPLINLRLDGGELAVSLYGEVHKEVIATTLATEYGLEARFRETTTIRFSKPAGTGTAVQLIGTGANEHLATVGLRVEPGEGSTFGLEVELGSMPYAFFRAVEETVMETLREWRVTDCAVTMTHSGYWAKQSSAHGIFDKSMSSTARDFRLLTPIVLGAALGRAGTITLEPLASFRLECPPDTLAAVLPVLGRLGGVPNGGDEHALEGELPAASVHALQLQLPALTRGEGVLETAFARYAEVRS
jgi:ribosomal protection tetracycline resistance protein